MKAMFPRGVLCALGDRGALGANAGSFCVSIRRLHLCLLEICGQPSALHAHTEPRARHIGCNLHTYLGSQSLLSPDAVVYICSLHQVNKQRTTIRAPAAAQLYAAESQVHTPSQRGQPTVAGLDPGAKGQREKQEGQTAECRKCCCLP